MKIWPLCFAIGAVMLGSLSLTAQTPPEHGLIRPGEGLPGVHLGDNFSSFQAVFPKHPVYDEDWPDTYCGGRAYHWLDIKKRGNGVYVYLRKDKIYLLSIQTPRFVLSNGIQIDSSEKQVQAAYPQGHKYILLGSGSAVVGGKDLIYWVIKEQGIAFELYWDSSMKKRLVSAINIFKKDTEFLPEGCVSPPQEWKQVP
jgi:hypothetical protein